MAIAVNVREALILSAFLLSALSSPIALATIDCPPDHIDASYRVTHIYDGDTVRLGNGEVVRFIGINSPEIGRDGKRSEAFARRAKNRLTTLLQQHNNMLNLRYDNELRDRYRRLLAHAYLGNRLSIGAMLLREGLAVQIVIPPNLHGMHCYRRAELSAHAARLGIWSGGDAGAVNVSHLSDADRGFRIVNGWVETVREHRGTFHLNVQNRLGLYINKSDRQYFGHAFLTDLVNKHIQVRGWISTDKKQLHMRLRHPMSIEVE